MTHSSLLEVTNLTTLFHSDAGVARAVDGVSFSIGERETVGLVGESGCGKSVTSYSILRLVPSPPGEIVSGSSVRFRGRELLTLSEAGMREIRGNDIGMIFQEPMTSLNPVFTVGEQIAEAVRLHRRVGKREAWQRAVDMLTLVGIPDPARRAHHHPHQFSGGQRQRVMIAMALCCDPDLLIADEPTTALDVTIQAQILDLLAELRDRLGMAMLIITHDLGVVAQVCDRVAVMYAGRIVEQAPTAELFAAPRHPYTEGLLRAIPRIGRRVDRLETIPGQVPGATAWPAGCRFHPRCRYAWDLCARDEPSLLIDAAAGAVPAEGPVAPDASAARCWLLEHPERRAPRAPAPVT
ncbi:MAG: ABC transporter ATP-binding protein [Gemmatimonadetes bacterium]|nr:ABC transporter ATP-binding protein [Gemmatimonadota bacterium]